MNVLSLFDGMSCGRLALDRLGIEVDQYYAAEIDKYAIQVTQENWPETIQLGDVTQIKGKDLPKIDLILAGSPCQGFSFAGKQLAFDDPRSALFFEFVRILKECSPKYFLLENVKMKKEFLNIITQQVGAEPILINSALVSAQNRQRYYWTNIPGVEQPENRGIVLRDILETNPDSYTLMSDKFSKRQERRSCLVDMNKEKASNLSAMEYVKNGRQGDYLACDDTGIPKDLSDDVSNLPEKSSVIKSNYYKSSKANFENDKSKGGKFSATGIPQTTHDTPKQIGTASDINGHDILKGVYSPDGKAPTLTTNGGGNREPKVVGGTWRGRYYKDGVRQDQFGSVAGETTQILELRKDGKTNSLTTVQKDNVVVTDKPNQINPSKKASGKQPYMQDRVFHVDGKSHALTREFASRTNVGGNEDVYWRKLTPIECERLQTVPDDYTASVSNTQRYKMLGNGWTIEVIAHILKNMKTIEEGGEVPKSKGQQGFDF